MQVYVYQMLYIFYLEKRIEELNEQRKVLTENLEAVVEDIDDMKNYISETGGIIKYIGE